MKREKISICFVASHTYSLFNKKRQDIPITGVDVQLYNWAKEFAKSKNYRVNFIVSDFGQENTESYYNIKIIKGNKSGYNNLIIGLHNFLKLFCILKKIDADVYIERGFSGPLSFEIGLFCRLFNKKSIHMVACDTDIDGWSYKRWKFMGILNKIGLKLASNIITQNDTQQNILTSQGIPSVKINNSFFIPAERKKIINSSYILWVGSSGKIKQKQPEIFLDLARLNPKKKFLIILERINDEVFQNTRAEAEKIPNLTFLPGIRFSEIDRYYKRAQILVSTSAFEGFPNVFIQAMINSVPILSLKVNPSNIITEKKIGLISHNNIKRLNANLNKLLDDQKLYQSLSQNCYRVAMNEFNIKKNIIEFKKLIEKN